jgi:hypothetical protein
LEKTKLQATYSFAQKLNAVSQTKEQSGSLKLLPESPSHEKMSTESPTKFSDTIDDGGLIAAYRNKLTSLYL